MIIKTCIIIIAVIIIAYVANYYFGNKLSKERALISIKESLDLAQIPIVTFYEGDIKLNFLLDTGSSESHISAEKAKELSGTPINVEYSYTTSNGFADNISSIIEATLEYKKDKFNVNLFVNQGLDSAFKTVKEDCGVQLHGILGSDFLKKYKYVLDYAEMIAYHK